MKKTIYVALFSVFLQSCTHEQAGVLLGASSGALIGGAMGGGDPATSLVTGALGAMVGGMIGGSIGKRLDERDKMLAQQSQITVLNNNRINTAAWENPDNGHRGVFEVERSYTNSTNQYCKQYRHTVYIDGVAEEVVGTACRNHKDEWVDSPGAKASKPRPSYRENRRRHYDDDREYYESRYDEDRDYYRSKPRSRRYIRDDYYEESMYDPY